MRHGLLQFSNHLSALRWPTWKKAASHLPERGVSLQHFHPQGIYCREKRRTSLSFPRWLRVLGIPQDAGQGPSSLSPHQAAPLGLEAPTWAPSRRAAHGQSSLSSTCTSCTLSQQRAMVTWAASPSESRLVSGRRLMLRASQILGQTQPGPVHPLIPPPRTLVRLSCLPWCVHLRPVVWGIMGTCRLCPAC